MRWLSPLPDKCFVGTTTDSESYCSIDLASQLEVPIQNHCGAFGVRRKHHTHEGVDLYGLEGDGVYAVEDGQIVAIEDFTGASVGSPWWAETKAVLVEGFSGVVVYGEISPVATLGTGNVVSAGQLLGHIKRVLLKDKGRPMDMLHLELHAHGTRKTLEWPVDQLPPCSLVNPTPYLLRIWEN